MEGVKWYHVAGAALLLWLWQRDQDTQAQLDAMANQAASAGTGPTQADVDAEHRAALSAREQIAKLDAALAAQQDITTQTVGAISGTVRQILPPTVNAPPRVVQSPPAAVSTERTLATTANVGDTRIVPKEGSLSIERDNTYGGTPTATTFQAAESIPTRQTALVVSDNLTDLRNLRTS